ncbi:MAG: flavin reductase family protein [Lachnospiraceae bacterium]|nr:flavin reductase family protein [Lachnospiraceae bacterium]
MSREVWKPGNMLYPVPAIMVTVGDEEVNNIITIAWTGTVNSDPAMVSISVRKSRYSHELLMKHREFVINLVTKKLARAMDYCGVKSGRDVDKFKEMRLTRGKAVKVNAPIIEESPVNIECVVKQVISLGSHDMFLAEVLAVDVDDSYMDESGRFNLEKANLVAYSHGQYYTLGENIGKFGFSVKKKVKNKIKKHR